MNHPDHRIFLNEQELAMCALCGAGEVQLEDPCSPRFKRRIDLKHAIGYDGRLIKIETGEEIPLDEPLFILRGRDHHAVDAIARYGALCDASGTTREHSLAVQQKLIEFTTFAIEQPERMKQPGTSMRK